MPSYIPSKEKNAPHRVLLVDDDLEDIYLFRQTLPENISLITAHDGEEALLAANAYHPELIFLDVKMPRLSGDEVCRRLRSSKNKAVSNVPIIIVSGFDSKTLAIGEADGFLPKPCRRQQVVKIIKKFIKDVPRSQNREINVLVIEDDRDDASMIKIMLTKDKSCRYNATVARRLETALGHLQSADFQMILTDLNLPDSSEIETLLKLRKEVPNIPIVILTGIDSDDIIDEAIRSGAQECLMKKDLNQKILIQSMKYAVERNNLLKEIRRLSLTDELTGLYNRGGFITCLEHEKKVIDRYGKSITVIYADIDNLKFINDHYGHHAGDRAIIATSQILKSFFRDSDILGRIGGDEFIAAVLQFKNADSSVITDHLVQKVDKFNAGGDLAYDLSVSFGYVTIDHKQLDNPWAAIEAAEAKMYINKKNRKSSR